MAKQSSTAERYPRSRIDKLGVKPGQKVTVDRVDDPAIQEELASRTDDVTVGKHRKGTDVILYGATKIADLAKLEKLRGYLDDAGMIWVVWPKGKKELREDDVREAALEVGLVDVKVMAFSETLSGLKLVIPVAKRGKKR